MGAERDRLGASCDRPAHGLPGVFVWPGGVVGLLPLCAVVVSAGVGVKVGTAVGLPGGTLGEPVVWVVGATVGVTGTPGVEGTPGDVRTVGVVEGVLPGVSDGVLLGSLDPSGPGVDSIV
ncbi:hypothetical protein AB0E63_26975 [Kribbella sp. NPDC026596]|uniref:hypothetical protein n=1 Tax=Kribbella sp. NPDC026596 TaxID=3155122 RepID=UPI0033E90C94